MSKKQDHKPVPLGDIPFKPELVTTPIKGFSGFAVSLNYVHPNMSQVIMLKIEDWVVIEREELSDPDSPSITIAKAEGILWKIYQESRDKR